MKRLRCPDCNKKGVASRESAPDNGIWNGCRYCDFGFWTHLDGRPDGETAEGDAQRLRAANP